MVYDRRVARIWNRGGPRFAIEAWFPVDVTTQRIVNELWHCNQLWNCSCGRLERLNSPDRNRKRLEVR
jgi:hypothetical protein